MNDRLKKSHITDRIRKMESGCDIDWATAEALAIGTLLHQGVYVCVFLHYAVKLALLNYKRTNLMKQPCKTILLDLEKANYAPTE